MPKRYMTVLFPLYLEKGDDYKMNNQKKKS